MTGLTHGIRKGDVRNSDRHRLLQTRPVASCKPAFNDPKYLRRISDIAMLSGVLVFVSAAVLFALIALEALLWSGPKLAKIVAVVIALVHASFLVNTAAQAKRALIDFWRCGTGREPVSFTPERITSVIEHGQSNRRRFDWFAFVFAISSPFTPVAVFALCEVFALQSETVWERIADARAAAHHKRPKRCDSPVEMLRTSREVVVARARTGVLAAA